MVANLLAGFTPAQRKLLHGLLTGLPSMQLVRAKTSTS